MHKEFIRILCAFLWLFGVAEAQEQVLRWGADPSGGAPYVFTDPANPDRYIGYEKEMVDALAQAMGRRAEFVPSDWETLVSALQRRSFDVIVNGLEPTGDRAQQILFSKPYYIFQLQLTVRRDDRPHQVARRLQESRRRNTRQHRRLAPPGTTRHSVSQLRRSGRRLSRSRAGTHRCGRDGRACRGFLRAHRIRS